MSNIIKSVTAVRAYGNGNNGNWLARLRLQDGTELFCGHGAGYSLAQAQAVIRANPDNTPIGDSVIGIPHEQPYKPLPAGVTIKA